VRLHYRIAAALEQQSAPGGPPLRDLAYHFGQAAVYKSAEKAVEYGVRAGDQASTALALEDAARYYEMALRALDLVSGGPERNDTRLQLHAKRGRSFFQIGQWALAKSAFEAALSLLDPLEDLKRCELLVSLAEASFWLMDIPALRRYAGEAQVLADRIGRDDFWADALRGWRAPKWPMATCWAGYRRTGRRSHGLAASVRSGWHECH
jgi:tetratricopeptide (TPR) repeat protein